MRIEPLAEYAFNTTKGSVAHIGYYTPGTRDAKTELFRVNVSVPLVLEYEAVAMRPEAGVPLIEEDVEAILDHPCAVGRRNEIFFLWRPFLRDPGDDLVLEVPGPDGLLGTLVAGQRELLHGVPTQIPPCSDGLAAVKL